MPKPFWSLHTHSRFSANDAMPTVAAIVTEAVALGYPALGLTDHGSMSGNAQLYTAARKAGISPLPGIEMYLTPDVGLGERSHHHLTMAAFTPAGYENLVKLNNRATREFYFRPRIDLPILADAGDRGALDGIAIGTGCYFGLVIQTLVHRGETACRQLLTALASWCPSLYVELQNHGISHEEGGTDDDIVDVLVGLADSLGLPYIIGQDSHYVRLDEQPVHDGLKRLVSFGDDPDEAVFPGDGYHLVDRNWLARYFEPKVLTTAIDNLTDLAERSCVRIPDLDVFELKVPPVVFGVDPQVVLATRSAQRLEALGLGDGYRTQLTAELGIVASSGMASYLLLVAKVCDEMASRGIWFRARGSASGSLLNWLLGITQIDPVVNKLRFDRFLSPDRTRPPDVDLDIEHTRRQEMAVWLSSQFSVTQIGTHMTYSLFDDDLDEGKGSLRVRYYSSRARQNLPNIPWLNIPQKDKKLLRELAGRKLISGYGTHAAGFVIADSDETLARLPLSYIASSKTSITSYGKKDVERMGFVKLDMLGLRDMTALRLSCHYAGIQPADIPLDDKATYARIRTGRVDGIFQLQGKAMAPNMPRLRPTKVEDLFVAQALYRPAMNSGSLRGDYLSRRQNRRLVPTQHEDIMAETKDTFGVMLYQEQVIGVLRRMRMPGDELTDMLDAVKASNDNVVKALADLEAAKPRITELARIRGWDETDVEWLIDALAAYGEYSFNLSHAAEYGTRSYYSAYLATNHPLAFWAGILTAYEDHKKITLLIASARNLGIKIVGAHVNHSKVSYSVDTESHAIRKGLISVHGVGRNYAKHLAAGAPYTSLLDLGQRIGGKVGGAKNLALRVPAFECGGAIAALESVGALEGIPEENQ